MEVSSGFEGSVEPYAEASKDNTSGTGDTAAKTAVLSKPEPDKQEPRHLEAHPIAAASAASKAADPPPPLPG